MKRLVFAYLIGLAASFKYDPFGRRINRSSSAGTSIYAYDGDDIVEETNAAATAVGRYTQGPAVDEPLAMLRSTNYAFLTSRSFIASHAYDKAWHSPSQL